MSTALTTATTVGGGIFQLDFLPSDLNVTWEGAYQTVQAGAYSDFFGYEFCLALGILLGVYLNIRWIRTWRYYLFFLLELCATILGISGFHFSYAPSTTAECVCLVAAASNGPLPSKIAYSALVLVVVNFALSILDMVLRFENRALHTLHLLLANATLWVGSIATTDRYRNNVTNYASTDLWILSFIAMWGGAMIALPVPGVLNYCVFHQGPYNPQWAIDPAENARNREKAKKRVEAEKKARDTGKKRRKTKEKDQDQEGETEMVASSDFVTMTINLSQKKNRENGVNSSEKKKKKRSKKGLQDQEGGDDEEEKPKKDKVQLKKDKDRD